jgi:hypothetical protein
MNPQSNPPPNRVMAADGGDRSGTRYYERFHLNQFYNAVEDEQLYTDEYTNMLHSYNEFMVNGNAMFSRMEQALRANLDRSIVRQSFYYYRYTDIRRIRSPDDAIYHFTSPPAPVPAATTTAPVAPVASAAGASGAPPVGHPPAPSRPLPPAPAMPAQERHSRLGDAFGRLLANYLTTENNRNARENARENAYIVRDETETHDATGNPNLFSMLYTYAQPIVFGTAAATTTGGPSVPTNDQINRATLNTMYSNIVSPVNTTCPISRDEFEDDSEITIIRECRHIFNRSSLREWFVSHSTCPMCRNDIRNYRDEPGLGSPSSSSSSSASSSASSSSSSSSAAAASGDIYSRIMDNSRNFTNMEINNITNDSVTFSYDLPPSYNRTNDAQIYRDILNAVAGTAVTATATAMNRHNNPPRRDGGDPDSEPDDYMDMD